MRMDDYLASVGNSFLQHVVKRPELSISHARDEMSDTVSLNEIDDLVV